MSRQELIYGALLHDIGKLYHRRVNKPGDHAVLGWKALIDIKLDKYFGKTVQETILFHHFPKLKESGLGENALAYLVCEADSISASIDRRKIEDNEPESRKRIGNKSVPLASVYNLLIPWGKEGSLDSISHTYPLEMNSPFIFPDKDSKSYSNQLYGNMISDFERDLKKVNYSKNSANALLGVLEKHLKKIPSSGETTEFMDISLFDHSKTTAAIAVCLYDYYAENKVASFKEEFGNHSHLDKEVFLLLNIQIKGWQDYIFDISGEEAIENLKGRSLFLEVLREHLVDTLLEELNLPRANILFSGGNEYFLLLPNTPAIKSKISSFESQTKAWFIENFGTKLAVVCSNITATPKEYKNKDKTYPAIFNRLKAVIDQKENQIYNRDDLLQLNKDNQEGPWECWECHRLLDKTNSQLCNYCRQILTLSDSLRDTSRFVIKQGSGGISLPFGMILEKSDDTLGDGLGIKRYYTKNQYSYHENYSSRLVLADYDYGSFEKIVEKMEGVKRFGMLLIDVDHLYEQFTDGFEDRVLSVSRTTSFSREFTGFMNEYLNLILAEKYRVNVIYSSGDDICIIGDWQHMLEIIFKFSQDFNRFFLGKMDFSMGLGLFKPHYPVSKMHTATQELLAEAKKIPGNSIALFEGKNSYTLDELKEDVFDGKLNQLRVHIGKSSLVGNSFLHKILELLRSHEEGINLARLAYLLARFKDEGKLKSEFISFLYRTALQKQKVCQLILAIEIFVMERREF